MTEEWAQEKEGKTGWQKETEEEIKCFNVMLFTCSSEIYILMQGAWNQYFLP